MFRSLLIVVLVICLGTFAHARTRTDVVNEALGMISITPNWTPLKSTVIWPTNPTSAVSGKTFTSYYSTNNSWTDWPYVYGGRETRAMTSSKINSGQKAPGGPNVDPDNLVTKDFYVAYPPAKSNRWPTNFLGGVDCAGFVYGSLFGESNIPNDTNDNAATIVGYSSRIDPSTIQMGDLLAPQGGSADHIQIITDVDNTTTPPNITLMEAVGGNSAALNQGKVRSRTISGIQAGYVAYTPFPILSTATLDGTVTANGGSIQDPTPTIALSFCDGTNEPIILQNIILDGFGAAFALTGQTVPGCAGSGQVYTYTPSTQLANGPHTLSIGVINGLLLESDFTLTFNVIGQPNILVSDANGNVLKHGDYTNAVPVTIVASQVIPLTSVVINDASGNSVYSANLSKGQQAVTFLFRPATDGVYTISAQDANNLTVAQGIEIARYSKPAFNQ